MTEPTKSYPLSLHDALPICSPNRDDPAMKEIGAALELRLANGVNIIIGHAKELSLSSQQLLRVVAIKRQLDSLNTPRSEEHTSELQSHVNLVCRLLLEKKNK